MSALEGINTTIFAYGQTASGKTFTIRGNNQSPGIIPLTIKALFEEIAHSEHRKFSVQASFMELYNETVNDLLNDSNKNLDLKENLQGIYIKNLTVKEVKTVDEALICLHEGDQVKKIGETLLNAQSSRSHTIFRLVISSVPNIVTLNDTPKISQLNIVDLAGSEGVSRTKAEGLRLK